MDPLRFTPILKRLRWGGRRLATKLGKSLGDGDDYAESWELCDHGEDQTIVAVGPWQGWTLSRLVAREGAAILGRHAGLEHFPLLCKFLDASDRLSVQVHPNDAQADACQPGERGKTEAWVIVDALPGSCVFAGLQPQVTRADLATAIEQGRVERCLHKVEVVSGDCLFIPAGTVHAIGEGVLLAEVQQSSDLTFRLFDWNRVDREGRRRPLHIAQSLAVIDFNRGPVGRVVPVVDEGDLHRIETLVRSGYFTIRRHTTTAAIEFAAADRCRILIGLVGAARFEGTAAATTLSRGETLLMPAATPRLRLVPRGKAQFLEVFWD